MKSARVVIIILSLFVLAPRAVTAQTNVAAERAWKPFFAAFREAVRRRDREALKKMMAPDFFASGGGIDDANGDGDTRDDIFAFWDEGRGRGWKAFERLLLGGAVPGKGLMGSHNGTPKRVAPPAINKRVNVVRGRIAWYAVFEFREDGRWYCTVFNECCD